MALTVETLHFDDLPTDARDGVSNNGCGKEYATYIRVSHDGEVIFLESDAMEPEDARFSRDLKWVKDALVRCYEIGKAEQ